MLIENTGFRGSPPGAEGVSTEPGSRCSTRKKKWLQSCQGKGNTSWTFIQRHAPAPILSSTQLTSQTAGTRQVLKRQSDDHLIAGDLQGGIRGGKTEGDIRRPRNPRGRGWECFVAQGFPCIPERLGCVLYWSTASAKVTVTHSLQAACLDWICLPRPRRQNTACCYFSLSLIKYSLTP